MSELGLFISTAERSLYFARILSFIFKRRALRSPNWTQLQILPHVGTWDRFV